MSPVFNDYKRAVLYYAAAVIKESERFEEEVLRRSKRLAELRQTLRWNMQEYEKELKMED